MLTKILIPALPLIVLIACNNPKKDLSIKRGIAVENTSADQIITAVISYSCDSSAAEKTLVLPAIQPEEIRYTDTICKNLKITGIRAAYYTELQESKSTKTIVQVLLTATLGIIGSMCFFIYQKNNKSRHEIKILIGEMKDVRRHFKANLRWIKEHIGDIQSGGLPLPFYLERFYSWNNLIMNSIETYRTVPRSCIRPLAHARLHVRNTDTEIRTLLDYIKEEKISAAALEEYWTFITRKHEFLIEWFEHAITYLAEANRWELIVLKKKGLERLEQFKKDEESIRERQPRNVIRVAGTSGRIKGEELDIRNRDSADISLRNFINMPPSSNASDAGINILHMNTKASPYNNSISAKAFIEQMQKDNPAVEEFQNDSTTLKYAVEKAIELNTKGSFLEFGFCSGTSINFIAALAYDRKVYGFDSLKGLKNTWRTNFDANVFAYKNENRFPFVPLANVSLIIGWLEDTLPAFKKDFLKDDLLAFINIDSDSFESAKAALDLLKDKIVLGKTVIVLDEGYNFSDPVTGDDEWKKHEYSAANQFASENNLSIQYLAYNKNHQQLVIMFVG